jgi:cell division protein FtsB
MAGELKKIEQHIDVVTANGGFKSAQHAAVALNDVRLAEQYIQQLTEENKALKAQVEALTKEKGQDQEEVKEAPAPKRTAKKK